MNWYKKIIISSYNLRIPEIKSQVDPIINKIINFYENFKNLPTSPILIGTVQFKDPYSQKDISAPIYIGNKFMEDNNNAMAERNRDTGDISFYISQDITQYPPKNYDQLTGIMANQLYHELSHAIDPKIRTLDMNYPNIKNKKLTPTEFDGYSKEIESMVLSNLNKDNTEEFKKWLSSPNILLSMPQYLYYFYYIISDWNQYKPEYIKLLRQRLYNSFIRNNTDAVPKTRTKRTL